MSRKFGHSSRGRRVLPPHNSPRVADGPLPVPEQVGHCLDVRPRLQPGYGCTVSQGVHVHVCHSSRLRGLDDDVLALAMDNELG
jgi:hypothetical protein